MCFKSGKFASFYFEKLMMKQSKPAFSKYQLFVVAILGLIQFTVILDFMVLSPLGAFLMPELRISSSQFGLVVSAYAFSAGASGLLAAGFADLFDRKKMLVFFYMGFIIGTLLCGIATDYHFLLIARVVTGLFGGVISSICFAIITDLFDLSVRGRVMGVVQVAFAGSQVLGIPVGLFLANHWGWHAPFLMIVAFGVATVLVIAIGLKPIAEHLKIVREHNAIQHLIKTFSVKSYLMAFATTILLATGGFMLMPFASTFMANNLQISATQLPFVYIVTGVFSMIAGPLVGKLSDSVGKYKVFCYGSILGMLMVFVYCNLGITSLWVVMVVNVLLFVAVSSRMIAATTLMTAVPQAKDRGAFMSVNSSVQQISGGIASAISGLIVVRTESGVIKHYDTVGYIVVFTMLVCIAMMYFINRHLSRPKNLYTA